MNRYLIGVRAKADPTNVDTNQVEFLSKYAPEVHSLSDGSAGTMNIRGL